jgi:hypothetical protein
MIVRPARWLALSVFALIIGCAETQTPVGLDGRLQVFSNDPTNPIFGRASDWAWLGPSDGLSFQAVYQSNTPALEITGGSDNAAIIRRLDAQLLATPFLFWSWSVENGPPRHPVRLVVGFADAGTPPAELGGMAALFRGDEPPRFSRSLALVWGGSAMERGSLTRPAATEDGKPSALYVVRGGRENRNRWWSENIDLSQLHALAWPMVDMAYSRIVFTGISSAKTETPGTVRISGLRLSR